MEERAGRQLNLRVTKTWQRLETQSYLCWMASEAVLLSECKGITEKISMRTAGLSTKPVWKNSLGL